MSNHYVYLLQHREKEIYYVGVRSCRCKIGDDTYMGSSSAMTTEDRSKCNKIILKRFDSRADAVAYEIEMHERFDVAVNPMFYNKAKQTSTGFDTSGTSAVFTDEHRKCLSTSRKMYNEKYGNPGRSRDLEVRKKLSNAGCAWYSKNRSKCLGRVLTDEHKAKIGKGLLGNKHPESAKEKIRETHRAKASQHKGFKPWWYEVDGKRTEVYDMTIKAFAETEGVEFHVVKDRFRKVYEGKAKQSAPLQGYAFGRITNG